MNKLKDGTSYSINEIPDFVKVGKYSSIAKDVIFYKKSDNHQWAENHKCVFTTNWDQPQGSGEIIVGNDVWIGEGVRILPNIHIGDGAIVGTGAVVSRDVPPFAIVVGNPQVIKRFRFGEDQMTALLKVRWWNLPEDKVEQLKPFMTDIDVFLLKCQDYGYL